MSRFSLSHSLCLCLGSHSATLFVPVSVLTRPLSLSLSRFSLSHSLCLCLGSHSATLFVSVSVLTRPLSLFVSSALGASVKGQCVHLKLRPSRTTIHLHRRLQTGECDVKSVCEDTSASGGARSIGSRSPQRLFELFAFWIERKKAVLTLKP